MASPALQGGYFTKSDRRLPLKSALNRWNGSNLQLIKFSIGPLHISADWSRLWSNCSFYWSNMDVRHWHSFRLRILARQDSRAIFTLPSVIYNEQQLSHTKSYAYSQHLNSPINYRNCSHEICSGPFLNLRWQISQQKHIDHQSGPLKTQENWENLPCTSAKLLLCDLSLCIIQIWPRTFHVFQTLHIVCLFTRGQDIGRIFQHSGCVYSRFTATHNLFHYYQTYIGLLSQKKKIIVIKIRTHAKLVIFFGWRIKKDNLIQPRDKAATLHMAAISSGSN